MLRTRPQNGITLIALIITVIVMLILVGVTINVAINGKLFEQAQEAANNTQIEAEREELLSAIVTVYDISTGTISGKEELEEKLGTGWTVEEVDTGYKIISPDGNVFTVDTKGNITDINGKGNSMPDGSSGGSDSEDSGSSGSQTEPTLKSFKIGTLMEKCTEVTGTDGGTYYDISVQDFNELIEYNILDGDFVSATVNVDEEDIGLDQDLYNLYGILRPMTYNTDPYIYEGLDALQYSIVKLHMDLNHEGDTSLANIDDPGWKFFIVNPSKMNINSDFIIELYVYENKNSTSKNDKYFIRFMVGANGTIYSKEEIKNNYINVWDAEINILSWEKVNAFMEQHQNCTSSN